MAEGLPSELLVEVGSVLLAALIGVAWLMNEQRRQRERDHLERMDNLQYLNQETVTYATPYGSETTVRSNPWAELAEAGPGHLLLGGRNSDDSEREARVASFDQARSTIVETDWERALEVESELLEREEQEIVRPFTIELFDDEKRYSIWYAREALVEEEEEAGEEGAGTHTRRYGREDRTGTCGFTVTLTDGEAPAEMRKSRQLGMEDVLQNLRLFYDGNLQELHKRLPPAPWAPYTELAARTARLGLPPEQRTALMLAELRLAPSPRKRP